MNGRKSYKRNYHKSHHNFRLVSEIRQWIIEFWYNFIRRLKNVLSERRLSSTQSLHTKSITNISAHFNTHVDTKKNINHFLDVQRIKSPVKLKKPRKHKRVVEKKKEIFEELSDDYLALYRKKSCHHLTPRQSNPLVIDKKRSSSSTKSKRSSRNSQVNIMVQEVTQKFIGDGFVDDLNWIPNLFGCILPESSTSRMSLHKVDNTKENNDDNNTINKLEKMKIRDDFRKHSKIPRYQYKHSAVIKSKSKIPYSKHHLNCINKN